MSQAQDYVKMACNWLPAQCEAMRKQLREKRLQGVADLEQRTIIKVEISRLDYNELCAELA